MNPISSDFGWFLAARSSLRTKTAFVRLGRFPLLMKHARQRSEETVKMFPDRDSASSGNIVANVVKISSKTEPWSRKLLSLEKELKISKRTLPALFAMIRFLFLLLSSIAVLSFTTNSLHISPFNSSPAASIFARISATSREAIGALGVAILSTPESAFSTHQRACGYTRLGIVTAPGIRRCIEATGLLESLPLLNCLWQAEEKVDSIYVILVGLRGFPELSKRRKNINRMPHISHKVCKKEPEKLGGNGPDKELKERRRSVKLGKLLEMKISGIVPEILQLIAEKLRRGEASFKLSGNGQGEKGLLSRETVSKEVIPAKKLGGIEVKALPFNRIL
nr:hypothetical protein Iba_chr07eCG12060 [Ipomoea batatas]